MRSLTRTLLFGSLAAELYALYSHPHLNTSSVSFFGRSRIHGRTETRIEFLGEQDGDVERDLKARLSASFAKFPLVRRAYLARVGFQPTGGPSVALCIASDHHDVAVLNEAQQQFKDLFAADAFLDMFFLSAEQEADVARVCAAFYERLYRLLELSIDLRIARAAHALLFRSLAG